MRSKRWHRFLQHPQGMVGAVILAMIFVLAVWGPQLAPQNPNAEHLGERLRPPLWHGPHGLIAYFGTDQLGRDLFSRVIVGARISTEVGVIAVVLAAVFGCLVGLAAGYYGGTLDNILMRVADLQLGLPFIVLGIAWAAFIGTGITSIITVVAISGWVQYARVVRGMALSLREVGFVEASTALGGNAFRAMFRHILPNVLPTMGVLATLQLGRAVLLEATLSFLGLGIQPPTPAWGLMLSEGRNYIDLAWWVTVFPGGAITLFVLASNFLGDAIRDIFDPRFEMR